MEPALNVLTFFHKGKSGLTMDVLRAEFLISFSCLVIMLVTFTNNFFQGFLRFIRELRNITRSSGDTVKLTCEVYADPRADLKWFKNDAPVLLKRKGRISVKRSERKQPTRYVSRLRIVNLEVHDSGFYKCSASNAMQTKSSTGVLMVKPKYIGNCCHLEKSLFCSLLLTPIKFIFSVHGSDGQDLPDFAPPIPNFKNILKT